jgi:hypothetical protein
MLNDFKLNTRELVSLIAIQTISTSNDAQAFHNWFYTHSKPVNSVRSGAVYSLTYKTGASIGAIPFEVRKLGNVVTVVIPRLGAPRYFYLLKDMVVTSGDDHLNHASCLYGLATFGCALSQQSLFLIAKDRETLAKSVVKNPIPVLNTRKWKVLEGLSHANLLNRSYVTDRQTKKQVKHAEIANEVVQYLANILAGCERVWVSFPTLARISAVDLEELDASSVTCFVEKYEQLNRFCSVGNAPQSGLFYRVRTLREFRALSLMQSYTNKFNSCQYLPLHTLPMETVLAYLERGAFALAGVVDNVMDDGFFIAGQDKDWTDGLQERYFTLGEDGLVSSRFYIFKLADNLRVANNFYNLAHLPLRVDGKTYVVAPTDTFNGKSYCNTVTFSLPVSALADEHWRVAVLAAWAKADSTVDNVYDVF